MEGLQLKKTDNYKFDESFCMTCQKQKDAKLNTTADGQTQFRKVTNIPRYHNYLNLVRTKKKLV